MNFTIAIDDKHVTMTLAPEDGVGERMTLVLDHATLAKGLRSQGGLRPIGVEAASTVIIDPRLDMGWPSSLDARDPGHLSLHVRDDRADTTVAYIELRATDFVAALRGRCVPTTAFELGDPLLFNTCLETKTEVVADAKEMRAHEVDGWRGRSDDLGNRNNLADCGGYRVSYRRNVS